jgi:hypothetical protein
MQAELVFSSLEKMVTVSSFVSENLAKLPNFIFHAPQRHSSVHRLLSHSQALEASLDDPGCGA